MRDQWYGDNRDVVKWSTSAGSSPGSPGAQGSVIVELKRPPFRPDDDRPQLGTFQQRTA